MLLEKVKNNNIHRYEFRKTGNINSATSLTVIRGTGEVELQIVSNPDYKLHRYRNVPCESN